MHIQKQKFKVGDHVFLTWNNQTLECTVLEVAKEIGYKGEVSWDCKVELPATHKHLGHWYRQNLLKRTEQKGKH